MTIRTLTAMFNNRADADRAGQALVSELRLDRAMVRTSPGEGMADTGYDKSRPYEEKGFFTSLKGLGLPEEDRYAYAEGMRRGAVLLSVQVEDNQVSRASDIIEHAGAVDLDAQEATWKQAGWTGYDASAHTAARSTMATGMSAATTAPVAATQAGQDDTIKVVEERLVVGKRAVEGGRVKVRSYVVERAVEEQVTLRDETVSLERHAVDRAATPADLAAFQERTIEMTETDEEAVIGKDVRVVEEIAVRKEAADRVETVRDTVRKTQVDVEDTTSTTRPVGATSVAGGTGAMAGQAGTGAGRAAAGAATGVAGTVDRTLGTNVSGNNPAANAPDGTPGNPSGTMASRAVDKTLGTNTSGANPGGSAPDGTPGNPPGTMASRAVDKALDTNISGANPGRKV